VADGKDVNDVRIRDLMTSGLTVCDEKTSIRDAARSMIDGRFRHLPVVEDAGVVGMVEIGDVSRALLNQPH
jgi:CBS domain-containing protein